MDLSLTGKLETLKVTKQNIFYLDKKCLGENCFFYTFEPSIVTHVILDL
jgi:hypothetical protein